MGEFMGREYTYDADNVLTRGLPVPPGRRPLAPGEPIPSRATEGVDVASQQDVDAWVGELNLTHGGKDVSLGYGANPKYENPERVVFVRIEWSPELLARIPEGFEAYDLPGEPPESVEGWLVVGLYLDAPDESGAFPCHPFGLSLGSWLTSELSDYGVTWCLARPKVALEPWVDCDVCGDTGMTIGGKPEHPCESCWRGEPWVDFSVTLPEGYGWARRGEPLGEGAMFARVEARLRWQPFASCEASLRPERCATGFLYIVPKKPAAVGNDSTCYDEAAKTLEAQAEMIELEPKTQRALTPPPFPGPPHFGFRPVDHLSREERDARAIDKKFGGPNAIEMLIVNQRRPLPWFYGSEDDRDVSIRLVRHLQEKRDSTWMRGGYEPKVTTVGVDDMSGDDVCVDDDGPALGCWKYL